MHPNSTVSTHGFPFRADRFRRSAANTSRLADLIGPFLRLSALVAIEMGQEATDARDERDHDSDSSSVVEDEGQEYLTHEQRRRTLSPRTTVERELDSFDTMSRAETALSMHDSGLQAFPTRNWFALAANLFTLAALEGYLVRGWRGPDAAEVLLGIGLGQNPDEDHPSREAQQNCAAFEPDGMPTQLEAARALFGGLLDDDGAGNSRSGSLVTSEALVYREEMGVRMGEFFGIAPHTPNLAAHLDGLVAAYPMEAMEHLATHFCKAVARWRGKPELETVRFLVSSFTRGLTIYCSTRVEGLSRLRRLEEQASPISSLSATPRFCGSSSISVNGALAAPQTRCYRRVNVPLQEPRRKSGLALMVSEPARCLSRYTPCILLPITLELTTHLYRQVLVFDAVGFHEESE